MHLTPDFAFLFVSFSFIAPHGVTNLTWPTPPDDSLYLADAFSRYLAERSTQRKPFLGTYKYSTKMKDREEKAIQYYVSYKNDTAIRLFYVYSR